MSNADDILAKLSPCFLLSNIGRHFDLKTVRFLHTTVKCLSPTNRIRACLPELHWQAVVEEHDLAEVESASFPGTLVQKESISWHKRRLPSTVAKNSHLSAYTATVSIFDDISLPCSGEVGHSEAFGQDEKVDRLKLGTLHD